MVTASLLRADDVEAERGVILEEIAMHEDDPADLVHDVFSAAALGDGPLGRPVLGTTASIAGLQQGAIVDYYRGRYVPGATVVAVSGALDHQDALVAVTRAWDAASATTGEPAPIRAGGRRPSPGRGVRVTRRSSEQAHLILGTAGVSRHDDRRYALGLLSSALGRFRGRSRHLWPAAFARSGGPV
jgi:predicted Zn-dependent peptidase